MTPKRAKFVREYLVDLNATQAAIRAGCSPKSAKSVGARMLTFADVKAAVAQAIAKQAHATGLTAERVLQECQRIAFLDLSRAYAEDGALLPIREMPEDVRRAVAGVDTEELMGADGPIGHVRKVRTLDKLRALELLGRYLKLFTEQVDHNVSFSITITPPET